MSGILVRRKMPAQYRTVVYFVTFLSLLLLAPTASLVTNGGVKLRQMTLQRSAAMRELRMESERPACQLSRRDAVGSMTFATISSGPWLTSRVVAETPVQRQGVKLGNGDSGLVIPEMGVGAWSWGDAAVWGYGSDAGATEASIAEAYRACLQSGITFFDTAEVYGLGTATIPRLSHR